MCFHRTRKISRYDCEEIMFVLMRSFPNLGGHHKVSRIFCMKMPLQVYRRCVVKVGGIIMKLGVTNLSEVVLMESFLQNLTRVLANLEMFRQTCCNAIPNFIRTSYKVWWRSKECYSKHM